MIEVVVLGSGTPVPTARRAGAATAVADGADWVMVDCGRAATQRALEAGLDLRRLAAVLITHHHTDHVSDLATLATTRWTAGAAAPLQVVAPDGPAARFAVTCLDNYDASAFHGQAAPRSGPRPRIDVFAFQPAGGPRHVLDVGGWSLHSALVDHHPVAPAVGYRIARGSITVAVSGDTAVCDGIRELAAEVDVLVHEALVGAQVPPDLLAWNAAADAVGTLAAETGASTLVLTHLLPAPSSQRDEEEFIGEVRRGGFTGPTHVARDLLRVRAGGAP